MDQFVSIQRIVDALYDILPYLAVTAELAAIAIVLGFLIGLVMAFIDMRRIPVLSQIVALHVSFSRGVPPLVKLYLFYCALPPLVLALTGVNIIRWDAFFFAAFTMVFGESAASCIAFKGAILGVPAVQTEAAYSIGMTKVQTFLRVVVPQAFVTSIPLLSNNMVAAFHSTSLAFAIGVVDMMGRAQIVGKTSGFALASYIAITIIYIVVSLIIKGSCQLLNNKLKH